MNPNLLSSSVELNLSEIEQLTEGILNEEFNISKADLKKIVGLIDLTSLNSTDYYSKVAELCKKAIALGEKLEDVPSVAAICVYPNFAETVAKEVFGTNIKVACVATAFPSGQTFLDIKLKEVEIAVNSGANEIDMVINRGAFLNNDLSRVFLEIKAVKQACGEAHLKVILETSDLEDPIHIKKASFIAMEAGADFIKTSTGKGSHGASILHAIVMCEAIREFYKASGKMVGFKPAGGISEIETAYRYVKVVEKILGEDWITPRYLRLGASSLANKVLAEFNSELSTYF